MKGTSGSPPCLLLVLGPPAAGKTTLARRLGVDFGLPVVHKDAIKEMLFDTLGVGDAARTQDLGRASIALLYDFVERLLAARVSVVAESNFHAGADSERVAALCQRHDLQTLQLHCAASDAVLIERYGRRAQTAERHPGHGPYDTASLQAGLEAGVWRPLHVSGLTVIVNTDDFDGVDYVPAYRAVREVLGVPHE